MNIKKFSKITVAEDKRKWFLVKLGIFVTMFCVYCSNLAFVFADTNYGENAGNWILEQLFWAAIVVVVIAIIGCLMKRAYATGGIILVFGSLACYFIKNPTKISTIGESLGKVFGF